MKHARKHTRKPTQEAIEAARAKRAALSARCRPIIAARKSGLLPFAALPTVNACLELIYGSQTGQTEWGTFWTWKERGFAVKKGETGFPIWGRPLSVRRKKDGSQASEPTTEATDTEIETANDYFPLSYLFHAGQVQDENGHAPTGFAQNIVRAALAQARRAPLALPCRSTITTNDAPGSCQDTDADDAGAVETTGAAQLSLF